ncbi:hypothetical protein RJ639_014320 [Escallonia herrerae]|uniref:Protein kinase n=1 Tax=Escallonia herrerae TaxID=1293975 RepID=A0AA88VJE3_9ASTE|nr:hypothetical protein RJ639_014320 [Escallonia herrerae]
MMNLKLALLSLNSQSLPESHKDYGTRLGESNFSNVVMDQEALELLVNATVQEIASPLDFMDGTPGFLAPLRLVMSAPFDLLQIPGTEFEHVGIRPALLVVLALEIMGDFGDADILELTADKLRAYTNGFSQDNFLGNTQFGKLYRGKIPCASTEAEAQEVTVKIWQDPTFYVVDENDKKSRLAGTTLVESAQCCHYSPGQKAGSRAQRCLNPAMLMFESADIGIDGRRAGKAANAISLFQMISAGSRELRLPLDLLAFLHGCHHIPYMVRNIDAEHIMIDQDFNPILLEFGMLNGGIFGDTTEIESGRWSVKCDVYSYGILLLSLIGKRVVDKVRGYETAVDVWAKKEYKPKKSFFKRKERFSLVHNSLQEESTYDISDGYKITELAMSCVECFPVRRPTMQKVSEDLQALHVVQSNAEAFGIKPDVAAKKPKLGSRFSIRW